MLIGIAMEVLGNVLQVVGKVTEEPLAVLKTAVEYLHERPLLMDGVQVVGFTAVNLFLWVPFLMRLVFKRVTSLADGATSDIPGNVHAFDDSVISAFRTLPEPNNFNVVYTGLDVSSDMVVRGTVPPGARFSSLSIYPAPDTVGTPDELLPDSIDLSTVTVADGSFEVTVLKGKGKGKGKGKSQGTGTRDSDDDSSDGSADGSASASLNSRDWKRGYMAMRNYLVPPGTRVVTPHVETLTDALLIRRSDVAVAGPLAYHNARRATMQAPLDLVSTIIQLAVLYTLLIFVAEEHLNEGKSVILQDLVLFPKRHMVPLASEMGTVLRNFLLGALGAYFVRCCLFASGSASLRKMVRALGGSLNKLHKVSLEKGALVSQPSALHHYFVAEIALHKPTMQMNIDLKYDPECVKYWSVVVYDAYGLPIGNYAFDQRDVTGTPKEKGAHCTAAVTLSDLRKRDSATMDRSRTYIDIGSTSQGGYVILRTVNAPPISVLGLVNDYEKADVNGERFYYNST